MISLLEDIFGSLVVSAGEDSDLGTVDNCEQHKNYVKDSFHEVQKNILRNYWHMRG